MNTDARSTFLSESTLTKLVSADNIESITLGMMMMVHKNRGIAEVKARRFFLTSGENRTLLKDYEMNEDIDNTLSPEQNTMIRLRSERDYKIVSNYINTGDESAVKSLIIKLMSNGVMYDILGELNIKRPDLLFKINQYYDSQFPKIHSEFSRFLFKYPKLEKKLPSGNRHELYTLSRIKNVSDIFKTIPNKDGELPTKEEVKQFEKDLGEMRANIKSIYEPSTRSLMNLFGIAEATFTRNLSRAQNELGAMIVNS